MRLILCLAAVISTVMLVVPAPGQGLIPDASGNGRDGRFVNGPPATLVEDGSGPFSSNYLLFDGQQASGGNPADWGLLDSYSMSLWFDGYDIHAEGANAIIGGSYADGNAVGFGLFFEGAGEKVNSLTYAHFSLPANYNIITSAQDYSVGWHHVVTVFEAGVGSTLYVDGSPVGFDATATVSMESLSKEFRIAGQDFIPTRPFRNGIDEVKLFDRALNATEVQSLYSSNTAGGAILDWNCNSLVGAGEPAVRDVSGNGHDGAFTGLGVACVNDGGGPHGGYLLCDGTAMVASNWVPDELTGSFTVSAWFEGKEGDGENEVIFGSYADGWAPGFVMFFADYSGDNQLLGGHVVTTSPLTYTIIKSPESYTEGWHQTALVFEEGVGARLYVDGVKIGEDTKVTVGVSDFEKVFTVAGQDFDLLRRYFEGKIDEVMVFDRALSDAELSTLYTTNTATDALLYWDFAAEAEPRLPGDANLDKVVNAEDAAILAANWQKASGATWGEGDFNGDYAVNDIDATILATNWLKTMAIASASASVPEPGATVLLLFGAFMVALVRRRWFAVAI